MLSRGQGHALSDLRLFDFSGSLVYFGTAAYAFEGLGVLLPIQRAMRNPERCPAVVTRTLVLASLLQVAFSCSAYVLYGEDTRSIITVSLSTESFPGGISGVVLVQLAWVCEVLLTFPLQ